MAHNNKTNNFQTLSISDKGNVRNKVGRFEKSEKPPIDMKNFKILNGSTSSTSPSPSRVIRPSAPPGPPPSVPVPLYSKVLNARNENVSLLHKPTARRSQSPDADGSDLTDHEYDTIEEHRGRIRSVRQEEQGEPTRVSHTHLNIADNRNKVRPASEPRPAGRKFPTPSCNYTRIAIILGIVCLVQLTILIILAIYLLSSKNLNYSGKNSITQNNFGHAKPGELIFYDDFNSFNLTTWRHDRYLSDDGFVLYGTSEQNSYVEDGILYIEPTFTEQYFNASFLSYGTFEFGKSINDSCSSFVRSQCQKTARGDLSVVLNPIMSATLRTSQSFSFKYGTIEIRAKMPKGDWISTEISLRPRYKYFGEPTDSAQIVLITTRGNRKYLAQNRTHFGNERFCSQLIYSDAHSTAIQSMAEFCQNSESGDGFAEDFHIYKFDWTPELMKIFLDSKLIGRFIDNSFVPNNVKHIVVEGDSEDGQLKSSFDQQFYIQLKVAVGIGFPDTGLQSTYGKPWANNQPNAAYNFWYGRRQWESSWVNQTAALQIDYIKVQAL